MTFWENVPILFLMIKFENDKKYFYFCTSANWSTVVLADSVNDAAAKSLNKVITETHDEASISPVIRIKKIEEKLENSDFLVRMDSTLSDIGMYKESKAFKEILENDWN